MKCDKCDSDESRLVVDYETKNEQRLCWEHRKKIVLERARQGTPSKTPKKRQKNSEIQETEDKLSGQTGIRDF